MSATLKEACDVVAAVRARRMLAGDPDAAARMAELVRHLEEEAELLDVVEHGDQPVVARTYPPGATVGWLLRHDPHVRALRRLRGLPIPEVGDRRGE